jgi:hypothetical protein
VINTGPIELTTNATIIVSSAPLWRDIDKGRLVRIDSVGQRHSAVLTGADQWTSTYLEVFGVTNARIFTVKILDTWVGTISLQRSMSDPSQSANWEEVNTWTGNTTETFDDGLDNQTAWYRIGFDTGNYTSGQAQVFLEYEFGSIAGVGRIWSNSSTTSTNTIVLAPHGNADGLHPSSAWYLGSWYQGNYPTAVTFDGGRLCWFGKGKSWLSISDDYEGFDIDTIGDSGPITRTITSGPIDCANWALSLRRLVFGTGGGEYVIRGSTEDDPLTPSNAMLRGYGTQGSGNTLGLKLDKSGLFVQRGGIRLMETVFGGDWEYETTDLTTFNPTIGLPGITHIALQRQPDNRVHCVRSDGSVAVLLHDVAENVSCWVEVEMGNNSLTTIYANDHSLTNANIDGQRTAISVSPDGTTAFIGFTTDNSVRQYTLTSGDIDTAVDTGNSFSFSLSATFGSASLTDMFTNVAGTRVYAVDTSGFEGVVQYDLSSGWDASTASDSGNSLDVSSETTNPRGVHLSPDGESLFLADGANNKILRYILPTAEELTGVTLAADDLDVSANPRGISLNSAGTELWVTYSSVSTIEVYALPTPYVLTGGVLRRTIDISSSTGPESLFVAADQEDFYVVDYLQPAIDSIRQYTQTTQSFTAEVEDIVVLPGADGDGEDAVYYLVKHTLNGGTTSRFLEKWSLESECQGGALNKNIDAHVAGTVSSGTLTGLTHLEGEDVEVWVNGVDAGTYTVTGGQITGVTSDGTSVAGLGYTADFKSAKLGNLLDKRNVNRLGVILDKTHYQGLQYGPSFDELDDLPLLEDETLTADDTQHDQYDEESFSFNGSWDTDSRVCLRAASPRNVTLLAAIIETED